MLFCGMCTWGVGEHVCGMSMCAPRPRTCVHEVGPGSWSLLCLLGKSGGEAPLTGLGGKWLALGLAPHTPPSSDHQEAD